VRGTVPVVRSLLSVAIRADATFVAAMIRTSCKLKPRVVIFHISATKEEIETQVRPCLRDESAPTCLWFTTVNRVIVVLVYGGGYRLYCRRGER
jgi:hypothetical protein